jgi:type IV secretory pathway component VirB8
MLSQDKKISKSEATLVSEMVNNGLYYQEALNWYNITYRYPTVQRALAMMACIISVVSALFVWTSWYGLYPLVESMPFAIYTNRDSSTFYPQLMKLKGVKHDTSNALITKFFIEQYIEDYEGYIATSLSNASVLNKNRILRVKHQSGSRITKRYLASINPRNPKSPYQKYGKKTSRHIKIRAVKLSENQRSAVVYYNAVLQSGKKRTITTWRANVSFGLTNIDELVKKMIEDRNRINAIRDVTKVEAEKLKIVGKHNLSFKINDYKVTKIK